MADSLDFVPKRIYLAIRHPQWTAETFPPRWRKHGALAMSLPRWRNILRYSHCDRVPCDNPAVGASDECDGVGLIWYRSEALRRVHVGDATGNIMVEDEKLVFSRFINESDLFTVEHVLRDGPIAGVKVVRCLKRAPGLSRAAFVERWSRHGALLLSADGMGTAVRRYVQNRTFPAPDGKPWTQDYDGVEEIWFDSLAALEAAHEAAGGRLAEDRAGFAGDSLTLLTDELRLYDLENPDLVVDTEATPP
ncbi:MAG: EthD domain-containing protein [Alphaproteobacteria bacterium]